MSESQKPYDAFLCFSPKDKVFADTLYNALKKEGLKIWYEREEIRIGDDTRRKLEEGLRASSYGIAVISHQFFEYWPESELSVLLQRESFAAMKVLPVILDMDKKEAAERSPFASTKAWISGEPDWVAANLRWTIRGGERPEESTEEEETTVSNREGASNPQTSGTNVHQLSEYQRKKS